VKCRCGSYSAPPDSLAVIREGEGRKGEKGLGIVGGEEEKEEKDVKEYGVKERGTEGAEKGEGRRRGRLGYLSRGPEFL